MNSVIFQRSDPDGRRQAIAELLLETDGPTVVVSSCAACLAEAEQPSSRTGHPVVRLFPCKVEDADAFNPLDTLQYTNLGRDDAITILLGPLTKAKSPDLWESSRSREPAWPLLAGEVIEAVASYYAQRKSNPPSLLQVANMFFQDSPWDALAAIVKHEGNLLDPNTRSVFQSNVKRDKEDQSFVLSIIHQVLSPLNTDSVERAVGRTTFDLGRLTRDGPATVYIGVPPALWTSHGSLVRLWLTSLLLLATRGTDGQQKMTFIVDDAAGLELFPLLRTAQYHAATRVEVWSFWESLGQLRNGYPADWSAFIGGCRTVQALGPLSPVVATELAPAFGTSVDELRQLPTLGRMTLAGPPLPDEHRGEAEPSRPAHRRGHTLTFAPAHADRCGLVVAPLLNGLSGTAIVVESTGAYYAATAEARAAAGPVVKLDPFGVLGGESDQFNPLHLVRTAQADALSDTLVQAELIMRCGVSSVDPYWNNSSMSLMAAVLQYIQCAPEKAFTLGELWNTFHSDDVVYNLRVVLDVIGKRLPNECNRQISSFLKLPDRTRSTILSHVSKSIYLVGNSSVRRAVEGTTFDLGRLTRDGPATVYIELSPALWTSHGSLVRLWLSSLLLLATRGTDGQQKMTFIVDDAAGLELFPLLRTAQHHAATRVEVWSFWESLGQLRNGYPADWSAFIGGCRTVQALGPLSPVVATELAPAFGTSVDELRQLPTLGRMTLAGPPLPDEHRGEAEPSRPAHRRGHTLTFAPAHADRCGLVVAPLLNGLSGTAIVVESTGAYYAATAEARAAAGPVVKLDPFGVLGGESDQFNPLDLFNPAQPGALSEVLTFSELLIPADFTTVLPFWRINAISLIDGILGYLSAVPERECSLVELGNVLEKDDVVYNLAVVVDTIGKRLPPRAYQRIAAFLQRGDMERTSLIAEASQSLRFLSDPSCAKTVQKTTFNVRMLLEEGGLTIYIVLPPNAFQTHGILVRMWLISLLFHFRQSRSLIAAPPLLIVDNAFPLGLVPILETAQRLFPGDILSFWESLGQLQIGYPAGWSAFIANARGVDALGPQSPVVAVELASAFGVSARELESLSPEQRITLSGHRSQPSSFS